MNRVLEYAAHHGRRGTAYGNASLCLAATVLAVPIGLTVVTNIFQAIIRRPTASLPSFQMATLVLDAPAALTIIFPILGVLLGALGLSLRCRRHQLVAFGVLVNIAGLIAAVGAIMMVG